MTTPFGKTPEGQEVLLFKIRNQNDLELAAINYGAIIQSLMVPDRNKLSSNVVLGYSSLPEYIRDSFYIGAIAGRYANRIANGKFSIDEQEYSLSTNNGSNHLHGGTSGFNKKVWKGQLLSESSVKFTYESRDGEEGYPGNLKAEIVYTLTEENELRVDSKAVTDKPTIVNLVQHSYFNLSAKHENVLNHHLMVAADKFLPVNNNMIPTGEQQRVENTPFDLRKPETIRTKLNQQDPQLELAWGFDHCWVLNQDQKSVASLYEQESGRFMEVFTTKPGIHIYTGNFLQGTFQQHAGVCLETESFPDSPNQHDFPFEILKPGMEYAHTTVFRFSVK